MLCAIGIGLSTTLLAVLKTTLLDPLPYRDADQVSVLWGVARSFGIDRYPFSWDNYRDYRDQVDAFEGLAAFRTLPMTLEGDGRPTSITGARVTPNFLEVLGAAPLRGAGFGEADDAGPGELALIGYGLWRRELAGAPDVVGRSIRLNGQAYTVVGVLPPGLRYPAPDIQVLVPLRITTPPESERAFHFLRVIGRLRPGATLAVAQTQLRALAARLAVAYPDANRELDIRALPLKDELVGTARSSLRALFGGTQLLFVIAWANVAILLLARGLARRDELVLRVALGATRANLLGLLVGEAVVLAGVGCALGLAGAWGALALLAQVDPGLLPRSYELGFDASLVPWAVGLSGVAALAAGGIPAWLASGGVASASGGARATDRRTPRVITRLVAAQVALALPLLVAAGVQFRSVHALAAVDVGYPVEGVLTAGVSLPANQYGRAEQRGYIDRALADLATVPGVESAGVISHLPFSSRTAAIVTYRPEQEGQSGLPNALYRVVAPGTLATLGIPIVAGRDIAPEDDEPDLARLVVDENLARVLWPGVDPIGRRVRLGTDPTQWEVVGVAGAARIVALNKPPEYTIYVPVAANLFPGALATPTFLVRSTASPAALAPSVRDVLQRADPHQALLEIEPLTHQVDTWLGSRRALSYLLWALAATALVLAAAGLYATLAFAVGRRLREMAIRAALGARAPALVRGVVLLGLRPWVVGAAVGVAACVGSVRLVERYVGEVPPVDPQSVTAALAVLLVAALTASLAPARRAASEDPARLLRDDGGGPGGR